MKNQVTSIEQSKRLIELGVPAEKASMAWIKDPNEGVYSLSVHDEFCYEMSCLEPRPAFTVADLICLLPKSITTPQGKVYTLHIEACSSTSPSWCLFWGDEEVQIGWQDRLGILHLLEDAIEWLVLKGYRLNV